MQKVVLAADLRERSAESAENAANAADSEGLFSSYKCGGDEMMLLLLLMQL